MGAFYRRLLLVDCGLECALRFPDLVFSHRRPLRCQQRTKTCRCLSSPLEDIGSLATPASQHAFALTLSKHLQRISAKCFYKRSVCSAN